MTDESVTGKGLLPLRDSVIHGRLIRARPCEVCEEPVRDIAGGMRGLRSDARFCSDVCRQRAYRKRRRSAGT